MNAVLWGSQRIAVELVLFLHHVGPRDWTQVVKLGTSDFLPDELSCWSNLKLLNLLPLIWWEMGLQVVPPYWGHASEDFIRRKVVCHWSHPQLWFSLIYQNPLSTFETVHQFNCEFKKYILRLIYFWVWVFCLNVFNVQCACLVFVSEGVRYPGTGIYRWLCVARWVLGIKPGSSTSAACASNLWTIHLAPSFF